MLMAHHTASHQTVPPRGKWRPSLGQVTVIMLLGVVMLPLVGLFFFRVLENQLVRETESELIAQSAVLAQVFAREIERAGEGVPRGRILPDDARPDPSRRFDPILPSLDLTSDDLLPARPDGRRALTPSPQALRVGRRMTTLGGEVQRVTLAGFRFLDANGVTIGGGGELGSSFAHVREVELALSGHYASVIRSRIRDKPAPPLYSISRGTKIRVFVAMPVVLDQRVVGVVYASRTPNNIVKYFYSERWKLAIAGAVVLIAVALLGMFFIRLINRPVSDLIAWTEGVSDGTAPAHPPSRFGTREISQLAASFEELAASLQQRSDYIATFAAHVSHELKSPLTTIQGAAELIREEEMEAGERRRLLDRIIGDTGRLTTLLNRLRELARAENVDPGGTTSLAEIAVGLRDTHPGIAVEILGETTRSLAIPGESLRIILGHLIDNSKAHGASRVRVTVGAGGQIDVVDDGDGISPGNRDRIFDAFFTTRREDGGTGIGLEIVKSLLQTHGGAISLRPSETGAHFRLVLALA